MLRPLILCALISIAPVALADTALTPPVTEAAKTMAFHPKGGERVRFQVLRQGKPFGFHKIDFDRLEDGTLQVTNDVRFRLAIGPVKLFNYEHKSIEVWREGKLTSLSGKTRKSGKDFTVEARTDGDDLVVDGTLNMGHVPGGLIPFSHWHAGQVDVNHILSSESGELIPISVSYVGRETLEIAGEKIDANHYLLDSELDADLWYADDGRWLKFAFKARGQKIEYRLKELY